MIKEMLTADLFPFYLAMLSQRELSKNNCGSSDVKRRSGSKRLEIEELFAALRRCDANVIEY